MSSYTRDSDFEGRFRQAPQRPTPVLVIAILHLVFGGLSFVFGLCSGVMLAIGPASFTPQPPPGPAGAQIPVPPDLALRQQRFLEQEIPFYRTITVTQLVLWLILSAVLIVAGIGLLGMRPWSRRLSLAYGIGSIVTQLASFIYTVTLMLPAMSAFYKQLEQDFPQAGPIWAFSRMGVWMSLVIVPVGLAYPIVVLVLLTRPKIVAAFANQPVLTDLPDRDWPDPRDDSSSTSFTR
jgi:hypothetical protein